MSGSNVTLKQLRAFLVVSDKGGFVTAAESLHMSQPALSQCIRQLEEQLGGRLFARTTRRVNLTPLGMSLAPHARDLLRHFDAVMADVDDMVARKNGRVRIACLPSIAYRLMPHVVAANKRLFPGVHVSIIDANMRGVTAMVMHGEVDLGIGSSIDEFSEMDSIAFARDEMHVVLPLTSPLSRRRVLHWADIADQPLVAMSRDTGLWELVNGTAQSQGLGLNVVAEVANISTLFGMIEEGIGMAILPGLSLPRNNHSFLRHRPLTDPVVKRTIRLYTKRGATFSPAASAVLTSLRQCIAEDRTIASIPNVEWDTSGLIAAERLHRPG